MKRLFLLVASLITTLGAACAALAEGAGETAAAPLFADFPLFTKGLIAAGLGLLGVFLVLLLFYLTIRLMQKIRS